MCVCVVGASRVCMLCDHNMYVSELCGHIVSVYYVATTRVVLYGHKMCLYIM